MVTSDIFATILLYTSLYAIVGVQSAFAHGNAVHEDLVSIFLDLLDVRFRLVRF